MLDRRRRRASFDWDAHTVTCPQGQTSTTWTPGEDRWGNAGINVKFPRPVCRACNFRSLCTRLYRK
ncbi:MAG: transposase [Nostocaceae cyanobacterium]|nr:transposase [Nostocaceae cyanobacterium]